MKAGKNQPVLIDDWDDGNAQGVRNFFTNPDVSIGSQEVEEVPVVQEKSVRAKPLDEEMAREVLRSSQILRPLRLLPVGKETV